MTRVCSKVMFVIIGDPSDSLMPVDIVNFNAGLPMFNVLPILPIDTYAAPIMRAITMTAIKTVVFFIIISLNGYYVVLIRNTFRFVFSLKYYMLNDDKIRLNTSN